MARAGTVRRPLRLAAALLLVGAAVWAWRARSEVPASPPRGDAVYDADGRLLGPAAPLARRPNLVVVVIDSLRRDPVHPEGRDPLMPFVGRLGREGVAFLDASAPAPWTMPSLGSLLTGLTPGAHGNLDSRRLPVLAPSVTTFAEILSRTYGYETLAFSDTGWLGGRKELLQGFDRTVTGFTLQGAGTMLRSWAESRPRDRPFFLLLHTLEAHSPYGAANHPWPPYPPAPPPKGTVVPEPASAPFDVARAFFLDRDLNAAIAKAAGLEHIRWVVRWTTDGYRADPRPEFAEELRRGYEEGVAWVDRQVERAVAALGEWGLLRDTLLVVTSDHGEAFGEHGLLGHGRQMDDELLRIPLVMRGPAPFEGRGGVRGSVALHDVLPTFLDWIGAPALPRTDGRSLLPVLAGDSRGRPVQAEEILSSENTGRLTEANLVSLRTAEWKYVLAYDRKAGRVTQSLYDLVGDPMERTDLLRDGATARPALPAELCERIRGLREDLRHAVSSAAPEGPASVPEIPPSPCD